MRRVWRAENCADFFGRRLQMLEDQLRKASVSPAFFVGPASLAELRLQAEELSDVWRWWSAVRSGERKLADGPLHAH